MPQVNCLDRATGKQAGCASMGADVQFNGTSSVLSGSSTMTFATNQKTPDAAVLCDINGTPQWCKDGTTFVVEGPVSHEWYRTPTAEAGPFTTGFTEEFGKAWHDFGAVSGAFCGFFLPLFVIAGVTALAIARVIDWHTRRAPAVKGKRGKR